MQYFIILINIRFRGTITFIIILHPVQMTVYIFNTTAIKNCIHRNVKVFFFIPLANNLVISFWRMLSILPEYVLPFYYKLPPYTADEHLLNIITQSERNIY